MNFLDHVHGKDLAVRLARELVGAVRGPHRNRERIDPGRPYEIDCLAGVGQQLIAADLAFHAVTVLLLTAAMFERTEHAQFAFDGCADPVRDIDDATGDGDIVLVVGCRLGIGLQRSIHHDGRKAVLKRGGTSCFVIAMILMHAQRNVRIHFLQRVDHLRQHDVARVTARAAREE